MAFAYNQAESEALGQYTQRLFASLNYEILDAADEQDGNCSVTGREHDGEVVLKDRLIASLSALNTHIPLDVRTQAIEKAVEIVSASRALLDPAEANREIYKLLKDGVHVQIKAPGDYTAQEGQQETVRVINWDTDRAEENDFLLVSNFWVSGREGRGRLDFVGFINGLPLLLPIMRVASGQENPLQRVYETDLSDYKRRFPNLFWYNACILLSDGQRSKIGSVTATWDYFADWKRIESEEEVGDTTVATLIIGICAKARLLDIVENFTLFRKDAGTLSKIIGRNHQYLGVNAAFARMQRFRELHGKLGVFWHTQGAGKSYSMIFFEQKVHRKVPGNWRFVVITDRLDLDQQIYENFSKVDAVTESEEAVRVSRIKDLALRLRENHSILFILIQKFQPERPTNKGRREVQFQPGDVPEQEAITDTGRANAATIGAIAESDEIIVMTDEAHRSEGGDLAGYMRNALPNASYLGFTGTPLIGEEIHRTRDIFGPYVSKYPFLQAIEDHVTVPLIYDNHTPRVALNFPEVVQALEEAEQKRPLNDREKQKLISEVFRKRELYKTSAYLDFVAKDIVAHCMGRGYMGKVMVVCVDKLTTVRLYNRVQKEWRDYQEQLRQQLAVVKDQEEYAKLAARLDYASTTDMAVVVSEAETREDDAFARFNEANPQEQVEIQSHYDRFKCEKLDENFKKESHPFRIAFVCAMWITGFDVPCLSTLYLVHPMTMHTLMQALARPNRLNGSEKKYGQIVDYVGIYEELMEALKTYARPEQGFSAATAEMPFSEKGELIRELAQALDELEQFCQQQGAHIQQEFAALMAARTKMERDVHIERIANTLVMSEDVKLNYLSRTWYVYHLYQALLPDNEVSPFAARIRALRQVQQTIFAAMNCVAIDDVLAQARHIIAENAAVYDYELRWSGDSSDVILGNFDLSKVNFDDLASNMQTGNTFLQAEQLRSFLQQKLRQMIQVNPQRVSYLDRLMNIVRKHNDRSADYADYPTEMVELTREVHEEELRSSREQLSEEGLAIADLLLLHVSQAEIEWPEIKEIARSLLIRLGSSNTLVDNWYNKPDMNSQVKLIIRDELDKLPDAYSPSQYQQKYEEVYRYIRAYHRNVGGGSGPMSA
jgi:type I restriction enzyme, R subunit